MTCLQLMIVICSVIIDFYIIIDKMILPMNEWHILHHIINLYASFIYIVLLVLISCILCVENMRFEIQLKESGLDILSVNNKY